MTWLWITLGVLGWLVCGAGAYPLIRGLVKWATRWDTWEASDAIRCFAFAAFWPLLLLYVIVLTIYWVVDRPAKW